MELNINNIDDHIQSTIEKLSKNWSDKVDDWLMENGVNKGNAGKYRLSININTFPSQYMLFPASAEIMMTSR